MKLNLEVIRFNTEDVIATSGTSGGINYVPLSTISGYENKQHISLYSEYVVDAGTNVHIVNDQGHNWVIWTPSQPNQVSYGATIPNGYKAFRYTWYDSGTWYTEDKSWNEMASEYGLTTDPTGWRTSN